jgi:EAL domain-containing protein (putative c-di-GMP-specific phosphodiesterase class I)
MFLPIFDIQTKQVASVEVLLQTEHPELQTLPLNDYLSIAEQTGLIKDIDSWLIKTSIEALAKHKEYIGNLDLKFYIRISLVDIQNEGFIDSLSSLLKHYDIPPSWLVLVINEAPPINEAAQNINNLQAIRDLGVNLALSHFGTSHTTLKHLLYYPIGYLKIDKSFVKHIGDKQHDSGVIVQAIMSVAKSYELDVIAEGVETLEQFYFLKDLGCNLIQGDLFSGPLNVLELKKALKNQYS